jgi:phosphoribosylaminoimidazole-succinocarboxamide synthase
MKTVYQTNFPDLKLVHRGKVRDIYDLGEHLLFVATDRISAFDVIMDTPISGKGAILSKISAFWFEKTKHIVSNHFVTNNPDEYPEQCRKYREDLAERSMLVKKCKPLPIEAVVRGYVAGSGWKEYKENKTICGIKLPDGLIEFDKLPEPIFTPATKEEEGHDENISFDKMAELVGLQTAQKVRNIALELYRFGSEYLNKRGLILADTKYEFGYTPDGNIVLIDEVMTPDSSRFWLKEKYAPGQPQYNFDKQALRDYLESIPWNKQYPPPPLPDEIVNITIEKYNEAYRRILNGESA